MSDGMPKRTWQQIAEEASHEKDSQRLVELAKELDEAMDERDKLPVQPEPPKARKLSA